ncbi:hypothetical protein GOBAR_AA04717 [Gossypium barbadense]|uniref:Uncharacterized protein n=1 Tax=Gossypium barbadense TaxID=3634 RepID=A0A2P5YJT1_GOSBA|nr:hypothetical protein GOBAR_AA04717 [Gossypium barbadense]
MSHDRGDLSHLVLGKSCPASTRPCLFPCLATALGRPVCLAVCAKKLCNSKIKLMIQSTTDTTDLYYVDATRNFRKTNTETTSCMYTQRDTVGLIPTHGLHNGFPITGLYTNTAETTAV